jgi:hypothetical protein
LVECVALYGVMLRRGRVMDWGCVSGATVKGWCAA